MNLTETAYGTWSGGRFMHFGETLDEDRYLNCIKHAYESGIRTFVTADVYGGGRADKMLGQALSEYPRDSYCLVGMVGHDYINAERQGSKGYPRFTDAALRPPSQYKSFLLEVANLSLANCQVDKFDLVMLHNPDELGYTSDAVWEAMSGLKAEGLTDRLGLAPGPANGFTLDMVHAFERFGEVIDWTMIILNPLEPWPGQLVFEAAKKANVDLLTRVVDYGGLFHGDIKPGHEFKPGDHRAYRPDGWIDHGWERFQPMEEIRKKHNLTMIQFAAIWNLSQEPVKSVVPTFIQEPGDGARPIEEKITDLSTLPSIRFSEDEVNQIRQWGDNTGCMSLKGASQRHQVSERPDEWPMRKELLELADSYGLGREW